MYEQTASTESADELTAKEPHGTPTVQPVERLLAAPRTQPEDLSAVPLTPLCEEPVATTMFLEPTPPAILAHETEQEPVLNINEARQRAYQAWLSFGQGELHDIETGSDTLDWDEIPFAELTSETFDKLLEFVDHRQQGDADLNVEAQRLVAYLRSCLKGVFAPALSSDFALVLGAPHRSGAPRNSSNAPVVSSTADATVGHPKGQADSGVRITSATPRRVARFTQLNAQTQASFVPSKLPPVGTSQVEDRWESELHVLSKAPIATFLDPEAELRTGPVAQ
jgi:hypothetical protein